MKYDLVEVSFWDHAACSGDDAREVPCTIWGLLIRETQRSYHVMNWGSDLDIRSTNSECQVILKNTVIKLEKVSERDFPPNEVDFSA